MSQNDQIAMPFPSSGSDTRPQRDAAALWFGLAVDHWQLFDALQDEWLLPPSGGAARLLGIRAFAGKANLPTSGNRIAAYLKIDAARLPWLDVLVRRKGQWWLSRVDELREDDDAIVWSGALPTSSIVEIAVSTNDEYVRIASLARQVSNVPLAESVLRVASRDVTWVDENMPSSDLPEGVTLPSDLDGIRGAVAMATWAVPRIDPWLELLTASLGPRSTEAPKLAQAVGAPWWAHPPWFTVSDAYWPSDREERLWLAAVLAFRQRMLGEVLAPAEITRRIARTAANGGSAEDEVVLNSWADETLRILSADTTIRIDNWKVSPVGKAIQLVLARPIPANFKTWFDDLPGLPPGVWWSAAALCGLLHGYRRLDAQFRGGATQCRLLAIQSLRASDPFAAELFWPGFPAGAPKWRRHSESIFLSWGEEIFASKAEHSRGRWFAADFADASVNSAARDLIARLNWPCLRRDLILATPWAPDPGTLRIRLPVDSIVEETLDTAAFLRCIAIEGGAIPAPPPQRSSAHLHQPVRHNITSGSDLPRRDELLPRLIAPTDGGANRLKLRLEPQYEVEIPGLLSVPDFLSETNEADLVRAIDGGDWRSDLKRRVQHYGWRYDYKARKIDASMRLGPLPSWAVKIAERLAKEGLLPHIADQVIVNEYVRDQGISKHTDCTSCFADGVAMISLLQSWEMIFKNGRKKTSRILERRSVAVMTGEARYGWTHEIPIRKNEPNGLVRSRRISLTFRKVIVDNSEDRRDGTPGREIT